MPLLPIGSPSMPPADARAREAMRARAKVKAALEAASAWSGADPLRATALYAEDAGAELNVEEWIERVLVPRVRMMAGGMMPFPTGSDLAGRYESDGKPPLSSDLRAALGELDEIFNR